MSVDQPSRENPLVSKSSSHSIHGSREQAITIGFGKRVVATLEQGELIGRRVSGEGRQRHADQSRRNAPGLSQLRQQQVRDLE